MESVVHPVVDASFLFMSNEPKPQKYSLQTVEGCVTRGAEQLFCISLMQSLPIADVHRVLSRYMENRARQDALLLALDLTAELAASQK
jgi:hypothetical protein